MSTPFTPTSFDGIHALVVGDVILDHYLSGRVERISPEAPVPVLSHEVERYSLGGAANVALNISALGATAHLVTVLGADASGQELRRLLREAHLSDAYLLTDAQRMTTRKTRFLARNQQLLRYDVEQTHPLAEALADQLLLKVEQLLEEQPIRVLILQDYNKGLLTPRLIAALIDRAKKKGVVTLADPKKANFLSYKGVDWFKPNLREVNEALGANLDDRQLRAVDLQRIGAQIRHILGNQHTLITLGEQGLFVEAAQTYIWARTRARAVADVCGAGDTVISVVALCAGAGLGLDTTLKLANLAGGQVCEHVGVVPVNKTQLWNEYQQNKQSDRGV